MTELGKKIISIQTKRIALLDKMVIPTRAAAAQMKDAGMINGAEPLLELLFQIDALDQERDNSILAADTEEALNTMTALFQLMGGRE